MGPNREPREPSGAASDDRRLPEALLRFEELAELPREDAESRLAELAERDPELHGLLRRMFEADGDSQTLRLATEAVAEPPPVDRRIGQHLGPYRILEEIGRGGMGVVYLGERVDGAYEARVAIKVVAMHLAGSEMLDRFLVERRLVGRLDHPGIGRVLDAGTDESGTPYFVMEHIDGLPLDRYCDANRLPVRRRLELFRCVCDAVAYAHRKLIVHRDLKPGNILVDRRGQPKLLDFGVAKLLEEDAAGAAVTQLGRRALTPDYASPEQLQGKPVSTTSDVYALGVVLYELLTGRLPFPSGGPGWVGPRAAPRPPSRVVVERSTGAGFGAGSSSPDTAPSTRVAADRGLTSGKALARRLRGDLEVILGRALQEDPERRYGSVAELSEDLRRHLEGLPIQAQPDSLAYRFRKFVGRNRVAVISALLILLSLLGGLTVSLVQARRAVAERQRAERASTRAEQINRFLLSVFQTADPSWYVDAEAKGPETRIIDVLDEASARIGSELSDAPLEKADLLTTLGNTYRALGMNDRAEAHLRQALEIRMRRQGESHRDTVETLYFLGASIVDQPQAVEIWERAVEAELGLPEASSNGPFLLADFSNTQIFLGRLDEADRLLREARARLASPSAPPANQIAAIEVELAIHRGDLALPLALDLGPRDSRARAKARALLLAGRFAEALQVLDGAFSLGARQSNGPRAIQAEILLGRPDEAADRLRRLRADGDLQRNGALETLLVEAQLEGASGRFEACAELAARVRSRWLEYTAALSPLTAADLDWVEGECLLGAGRPDAALPLLASAATGFAELFAGQAVYGGRVEAALSKARSLAEMRAAG